MAFNDQIIPTNDKAFPVSSDAFADVNNPTDVELLAWVNINVPVENRSGSLVGYNRPTDPVSTTTFIYLWQILNNPSLKVIRLRDNRVLGTKWYYGSAVPLAAIGGVGDFYLRTVNYDVFIKTQNDGWQIVGNFKGAPGDAGEDGEDGDDGSNGTNGREVQFQNSGTHIQWRYVGDVSWTNLVALSAIKGLTGDTGPVGPGLVILGTVEEEGDLPGSANAGDAYIVEGDLYVYDGGDWNNAGPIVGPQGAPGNNGTNGKEVELQTNGTHIQWRLTGGGWVNLIALSALTGATGNTGNTGTAGTAGTNGTNGKEVQLQNNGTYIQWRFVGDVSWNNLVALSALKGDAGNDGSNGTDGTDGQDGLPIAINKISGTLNWNSYNIFTTGSGITATTLPSGVSVAGLGLLCMIVNARASGNISINMNGNTLIGHAAKVSLAPNEAICFIRTASGEVGVFSIY